MAFVGIDQVLHYNLGGAAIRFDQAQGGEFTHPEGDDVNHYDGIRGQATHNYGGVSFGGNAETLLQAGTLLTGYTTRASITALPAPITYIQGGLVNVANKAKTQTTCYIDSASVSCEIGGLVTVNYDWVALAEADSTIAAAANPSAVETYSWHRADIELGGGSYQCERWEVSYNNSLAAVWSLDRGTANRERWVEEYTPGMPECTFSLDFRADVPISMTADEPAAFDVVIDCLNGTNTFAIDTTAGLGLWPTGRPLPLAAGGDSIVYRITGELEHDDACLLTAGNLFSIV